MITKIDKDLYTRAAAIFGTNSTGAVYWPHGAGMPDRSNYRGDETAGRYEEAVRRAQEAQRTVVDWAEHYGLKTSKAGCCPKWLIRKRSMRCTSRSNPCTRYGSNIPDHGLLDHATAWIKDGVPTALTSAVYGVSDEDRERMAFWQATDSRLGIVQGTGWYGFGTTQIVMWRSDIIADVRPAPIAA